MTPADAIRSATISSAQVPGFEDKFATLEAGKLADLIAVSGNHAQDRSILKDDGFVMRNGKVMTPPH